jgi:hypothetical protein
MGFTPIASIVGDSIQDTVLGLRYLLESGIGYTASSFYPCQRHYLEHDTADKHA